MARVTLSPPRLRIYNVAVFVPVFIAAASIFSFSEATICSAWLVAFVTYAVVGGLIVGGVVYGSPRAGLVHVDTAAVILAVGLWAPQWMKF